MSAVLGSASLSVTSSVAAGRGRGDTRLGGRDAEPSMELLLATSIVDPSLRESIRRAYTSWKRMAQQLDIFDEATA